MCKCVVYSLAYYSLVINNELIDTLTFDSDKLSDIIYLYLYRDDLFQLINMVYEYEVIEFDTDQLLSTYTMLGIDDVVTALLDWMTIDPILTEWSLKT